MNLIRLQKIISSSGICSRRRAECYIKDGYVTVNGNTVKVLGSKVDPMLDVIHIKGCKIEHHVLNTIYIALNKPKGYVSTCFQINAKPVTDLINLPDRLFPVGRLDKNSTGLLLMTNDGRIHHRLSHPSFGHEKEYYVETFKPITNKKIHYMRNGIILNNKITAPAKVVKLSKYAFKIILVEGRNRQIRRMVKHIKNKVSVLKRTRVENIKLGTLKTGKWRHLSQKEKKRLLFSLKLN